MVCHGYGCWKKSHVSLSADEWAQVKAPLKDQAKNAAEERKHIAAAISVIEQITGRKIGTDADVGGATIRGHGLYQMDCIDEAVNTSLYLEFLDKDGALQWHNVGTPARRGTFIDGEWPHNTAVVSEKEGGAYYVIDSWFSDNGQEPAIVPLQDWLDGWRP